MKITSPIATTICLFEQTNPKNRSVLSSPSKGNSCNSDCFIQCNYGFWKVTIGPFYADARATLKDSTFFSRHHAESENNSGHEIFSLSLLWLFRALGRLLDFTRVSQVRKRGRKRLPIPTSRHGRFYAAWPGWRVSIQLVHSCDVPSLHRTALAPLPSGEPRCFCTGPLNTLKEYFPC